MKISKKTKLIYMSLILTFSIIISSVGIYISSKADETKNNNTNTNYNLEYKNTKRDTSLSVDSSGKLNITRNQLCNTNTSIKEDSWTLFFYMTGSNLESEYECASSDIQEMLQANFTEENLKNLNVIIQTGGSKKWHSNRISNTHIERAKVNTNSFSLTNLQRLPNANMGTSDTLYDFLSWGIDNYPAKRMGIVFWNHGSGVQKGLCFDENYDDDSLSVHELEYTFAKLSHKMPSKFELVGFDTCLTGSLEYANILAPYANYMVGSADVAIAKGWYYTAVLNFLLENPGATGAELGKIACTSTANFLEDYAKTKKYTIDYTYATYDLSKVDEVCINVNDLGKFLYDTLTTDANAYRSLVKFRNNLLAFEHDCVDIGSILHYFKNEPAYSYDVSKLEASLDQLVIHSNFKNKFDNNKCGKGITLYIPNDTYDIQILNTYRNVCFSPYLLKYFDYMNTRSMTEDMNSFITIPWETNPYFFEDNFDFINYDIPYNDDNKNINEDAKAILSTNENYVNNGFVDNWYNNVTYSKNNTTRTNTSILEEVSQVKNVTFTTIDNQLICIGQGKNNTSQNNWFALPDGQLLTTYVLYNDNHTTIYSFPVLINNKEYSIRIEKTTNDNSTTYTTLGVWDTNDNPKNKDHIARGYLPINEGTVIKPIYDIYNRFTKEYHTSYGESYTIGSDFEYIFSSLDDKNTIHTYEFKKNNGSYIYDKVTN